MHNVAIHCCHGYFFKEFYCPLIKQIKDRFNVYLFIENSFLSKEVIDLANELLRKGFIKSYKITKLYPYIDRYKFTDIVYLLRYHFRYNRFINQLFSKKIYYHIISEDRTVFSRILISKINRRNGKAILIVVSTPGDFFYENFRKNKKNNFRLFRKYKTSIEYKYSFLLKLKSKVNKFGYLGFIIYVFKLLFNKEYVITALDYKIFSFLFNGVISPNSQNVVARHVTGFSNFTIVFDAKDYEGFSYSINNLLIAKHPLLNYCKNIGKNNKHILLILVGGILGHSSYKLPQKKMLRWISALKTVIKLKNPRQIHIRFHPLEEKNIINQFEKEFLLNSIQYTIINSKEVSLINSMCDYFGVLGSPTSALKIARWSSKEIFVLCLDDVTIQGFGGSSQMIGDSEGITIVDENTVIRKEMLKPLKKLSFYEHKSIKEHLINIINDS